MYPKTYFETFMRYEASDEVFVAMPFTDPFRVAFDRVIEPAIRSLQMDGGRDLVPRIINRATSGAPDIHEQIFDAIVHSRLVIADMTVQASCVDDTGGARWQANANVAYEVGLASAWRNPEDILLIHQPHARHSYSFDVQNLRHVPYDPALETAPQTLALEIVRSINQSSFLAKRAYQKMIEQVSPTAIQFMHEEVRRAFPIIAFDSVAVNMVDRRVHAATELLGCGALKNRQVVKQGSNKGVAVIYAWTDLGLRMLQDLHAASAERVRELRAQIASVPAGSLPPPDLRDLPEMAPYSERESIDMVKAAEIDRASEATPTQNEVNGVT